MQREGKRKELIIPLARVPVSTGSDPDAVRGHQYDAAQWGFLLLDMHLMNLVSE